MKTYTICSKLFQFVITVAACSLSIANEAMAYPDKPITLIIPWGAGNAGDINGRIISKRLSERLGQAIVVENRPGAGGVMAVKKAANAPADGYTLLYAGVFTAITQNLFTPAPYDMQRDFDPVATTSGNDLLILVAGKSKYKNLQDLVKELKEKNGSVMCGISLLGSGQHMSAELFKQRAGVGFMLVPFNGSSKLAAGLRSGDIDCAFEYAPSMLTSIESGDVRALAVGSEERSNVLPDVPTVIEQNIADYVMTPWVMFAVPKGTPEAIVQKLNDETQKVLADPEVIAQLRALGTHVKSGNVKQTQDLMKSEIQRWGEVIRKGNIKLK